MMAHMVRTSALALAVVVIASASDRVGAVELFPDDPLMVSRGGEIYQQECASCHGANLEGQPNWQKRLPSGRLPAPPHDENGHTWHHRDDVLFELTKQGTAGFLNDPDYPSDMLGYADILSDLEIVAVLSFIKSQWPPETRAMHDRINDQASRR